MNSLDLTELRNFNGGLTFHPKKKKTNQSKEQQTLQLNNSKPSEQFSSNEREKEQDNSTTISSILTKKRPQERPRETTGNELNVISLIEKTKDIPPPLVVDNNKTEDVQTLEHDPTGSEIVFHSKKQKLNSDIVLQQKKEIGNDNYSLISSDTKVWIDTFSHHLESAPFNQFTTRELIDIQSKLALFMTKLSTLLRENSK
jgi:hypothetical protein